MKKILFTIFVLASITASAQKYPQFKLISYDNTQIGSTELAKFGEMLITSDISNFAQPYSVTEFKFDNSCVIWYIPSPDSKRLAADSPTPVKSGYLVKHQKILSLDPDSRKITTEQPKY